MDYVVARLLSSYLFLMVLRTTCHRMGLVARLNRASHDLQFYQKNTSHMVLAKRLNNLERYVAFNKKVEPITSRKSNLVWGKRFKSILTSLTGFGKYSLFRIIAFSEIKYLLVLFIMTQNGPKILLLLHSICQSLVNRQFVESGNLKFDCETQK